MENNSRILRRVLVKGLAAGGFYVLLWILVVRGHYVWAFPPSALIAILVVGILPVCLILLHGGLSGWGWCFLFSVFFSALLNYVVAYNPLLSSFLYGPNIMDIGDELMFLGLQQYMAMSKVLAFIVMLFVIRNQ